MSSEVETSLDSLKISKRFLDFARNDNSVTSRYFTESAGTILMLSITTRLVGLLGSPMLFLVDRNVTDFLQHILAFNQFAEGRVLMIEPVHRGEADEELRTGGVRIRTARHRNTRRDRGYDR